MIGKRPRSFSLSLQPPPIASKEFKFSAPHSPASSGAATSIARQKLAKALDLISGGEAKDTESVTQLLRDCIHRARIYFDDESKTVISTASTVLARLHEIQHNDQRRSSRKLYESAVHADQGNLDAAYELACILKLDAVGKEDLMYVEELLRLASGVDEKWVGGRTEEDQRRGRASDNEGRRVRHESERDTDMDEGEARKERVDARREGTMFPESREAFEEEREGLEASNIWGYDSGGAVEASDQESQPCQRKAKEALALLWMQTGTRSHRADHVLRQLGFTHRLASRVLAYPPSQSLEASDPAPLSPSAGSFLRVYDHVLPPAALLAMQRLFAPRAPFWEEHGYFRRDRGYFSYLLPLSLKSVGDPTSSSSSSPLPPSMAVEAVVRDHLLPLAREAFPHLFSSPACSALSSCSSDLSLTAEWWAHCRRHAEGHQLHFDSLDEGKGFVRHPLVSCVLYLAEADGVGGPTLVTDQALSDGKLARKGWLCHGRENRVCFFDAKRLHGVVPGRGVPPEAKGEGEEKRRRITFMVGFWKGHIPSRPAPPPQKQEYTGWGDDMANNTETRKGFHNGKGRGEDDEESEQPCANMAVPSLSAEGVPCPRWLRDAWRFGETLEGVRGKGNEQRTPARGGLIALDRVWEKVGSDDNKGTCTMEGESQPLYQECFQGF